MTGAVQTKEQSVEREDIRKIQQPCHVVGSMRNKIDVASNLLNLTIREPHPIRTVRERPMKIILLTAVLVLVICPEVRSHAGHLRSLQDDENSDHPARCGTKDLAGADLWVRKRVLSLAKLKKKKSPFGYQANSPKVIPVCFHIIGGQIRNRITNQDLVQDLSKLNQAFSASSCCDESLSWCNGNCSPADPNIQFTMAKTNALGRIDGTTASPTDRSACVKRTAVSWRMFLPPVAWLVKRFMHKGDGRVLNVYFANLGSGGLLGYARFPDTVFSRRPYLDGVVINRHARVGGRLGDYNEGDTLAHEVNTVCITLVCPLVSSLSKALWHILSVPFLSP